MLLPGHKPVAFIYFFRYWLALYFAFFLGMGWLLRECIPEAEKRLSSFLAPNMSQKNHSFWKIKNRVVLPVGFSFSHLLPPYPAPIAVFNCWKWGHSGSGLNCLGLRMEVMWSAWSHRVAPDLNPQPLGNKTIWKVFSYYWFFFFFSSLDQANTMKPALLWYCAVLRGL